MSSIPRAMTIAGSDSGGGAGVQADLKTFASFGVYGTCVLSAVTAQNTHRVTDIFELPVSLIMHQIDAVMTDIGTNVVKTGMLSSTAIIESVADKLSAYSIKNLVVDPVMIAKGGDRLLQEDSVASIRTKLIPLASVVTPNTPEAAVLTGREVDTVEDAKRAAKEIINMGASAVVVKGGHLDGPATDVLYDGRRFQIFSSPRIESKNTHGTGCTFASAIAANMAKGKLLEESITLSKEYINSAIREARQVGSGHGPLNHFFMI